MSSRALMRGESRRQLVLGVKSAQRIMERARHAREMVARRHAGGVGSPQLAGSMASVLSLTTGSMPSSSRSSMRRGGGGGGGGSASSSSRHGTARNSQLQSSRSSRAVPKEATRGGKKDVTLHLWDAVVLATDAAIGPEVDVTENVTEADQQTWNGYAAQLLTCMDTMHLIPSITES